MKISNKTRRIEPISLMLVVLPLYVGIMVYLIFTPNLNGYVSPFGFFGAILGGVIGAFYVNIDYNSPITLGLGFMLLGIGLMLLGLALQAIIGYAGYMGRC